MMNAIRKSFTIINGGERRKLVGISALVLLNTVLEVFGVSLIFPFIQLANDPESLFQNPMMARLYHALDFSQPRWFLLVAGLAFLAVILSKNVVFYIVNSMQVAFSHFAAARVAQRILARYLTSPYAMHLDRNSSTLITNVNTLVDTVFGYVILPFINLVTELFVLVGVLAVLMAYEPTITTVTGGFLAAIFFGIYFAIRRRLDVLGREHVQLLDHRLRSLQQALAGIKEIKVLGREHYFHEQFAALRQRHAGVTWAINNLSQVPRLTVETLVVAAVVAVIVIILAQDRPTSDVTAVLSLFAVAAFRMIPSINRAILAVQNIRLGAPAVDAVTADMPSTEAELSESISCGLPFERDLGVEGVCFRYNGAERDAVSGIQLTIRRGESIGFVGPSGSGKTTLIDIILGLLTPSAGRITVDDRNIADTPKAWQRRVGYVPQTATLIDDTVRRNIALGITDDAIDDALVMRAMRLAQLEDVVRAMPQGLDTELGENGVRLSGGQRQRIAIARALYHDPEVLVLDEATAALDTGTEMEVSAAIEGLRGTKTLLIIAHRLSTVKHCDRVVLMKDGTIVDAAPFDVLHARCPEFRHMVGLAKLISAAPEDLNAIR